ncbi:MAG: hypothetical protein Q7R47_03555, partial [Candidatus Diapherotrites archaeon]|nr:hypothetical protein [Candidatus Diapherotrites archaeon]
PVAFSGGRLAASEAAGLLAWSSALLAGSLVVLVLDVWISSWYPVLVSDFKANRSVSFSSAITVSNRRARIALPLLIAVELLLSLVLSIVLSQILVFAVAWFWVAAVVSVLVLFGVYIWLYPLLSVSVLESASYGGVLRRSFALSAAHWKLFSLPAALSLVVSLLNFGLAFLAEKPEFLALFWLVRIGMALLVTYLTVLNPSAYLAVSDSLARK